MVPMTRERNETVARFLSYAGTQERAARILGVTQATISRWLAGIDTPPATATMVMVWLTDDETRNFLLTRQRSGGTIDETDGKE